ncbi:hypothetical protein GOODEAATRI_012005 [Goodea atripinnis]|uniref:Uncharacterized protein n=1 Tax=Goodea atripinnis TaxID=208336 RepID=A0ABV0MHB1_9TELE
MNDYSTAVSPQICGTSALRRKNLAAAGPEKFTPEFIQKQIEEFEIGKRHLANMMGEDPENFNQEDIDVSLITIYIRHRPLFLPLSLHLCSFGISPISCRIS